MAKMSKRYACSSSDTRAGDAASFRDTSFDADEVEVDEEDERVPFADIVVDDAAGTEPFNFPSASSLSALPPPLPMQMFAATSLTLLRINCVVKL